MLCRPLKLRKSGTATGLNIPARMLGSTTAQSAGGMPLTTRTESKLWRCFQIGALIVGVIWAILQEPKVQYQGGFLALFMYCNMLTCPPLSFLRRKAAGDFFVAAGPAARATRSERPGTTSGGESLPHGQHGRSTVPPGAPLESCWLGRRDMDPGAGCRKGQLWDAPWQAVMYNK